MATIADDARDRAFERLYEGHVRDVYRYVLAVLRNPADAEDVTQTTFMNAYRAFKGGERPRTPQNWLITIAHNACRTRAIRASRRPREVPLDDVVARLAVPEQERPSVRELLAALGRLPFNQRSAIAMRELEGRSYDEIAETLGVSVAAVEGLLVRARRALRLQGSALRGLLVVQFPRSLRSFFESGDVATAGGALAGGGTLAKAVAVIVAGVVAGGAGYATVQAGAAHRAPAVVRPEPARGASAHRHRGTVIGASRRARDHARLVAAPSRSSSSAPRGVVATVAGPSVRALPVRTPAPAPAPASAEPARAGAGAAGAAPPVAVEKISAGAQVFPRNGISMLRTCPRPYPPGPCRPRAPEEIFSPREPPGPPGGSPPFPGPGIR